MYYNVLKRLLLNTNHHIGNYIMPPKYVLIAGTDKDKEMVADLEKEKDELTSKLKAMDEEHKKEMAKLKGTDSFQNPGPVVKAIVAGMDEDHKEEAKKAAMDEIEKTADMDEDEKTKAKKALEEIFDTGNGVNTNANHLEEEKETAAVIATLSAKVSEPLIKKILTAKTKAGATEDEINADLKRLAAMTLPQIEKEFESNKIFINQSLSAETIVDSEAALVAANEKGFDFNGVNGPLTGKATDIDAIISEATL